MSRIIILITTLFISGNCAFGQSEKQKELANEKGATAIELMDNGKYDESIKLLKECVKLDPSNHVYLYEIGYAYIFKKKYKKATTVFEKVIKMDDSNAQCYQMLGNAYSSGGERDKAIDAYKRGLSIYPNAGRLYLELGNVHQDDWNEALKFYEKGVEVDPEYPSNYYWLTKIFCNSSEEIWGMFYCVFS